MSATKAQEIRSNPNGDRNQCSICNPRRRIRYDRIVEFFEKHGYWPLRRDLSEEGKP